MSIEEPVELLGSPVEPNVDFERDGVQHGFLRLPHSRNESAWGSVMIPITVVKGGAGPTALLTGGNHGDEYEGPVALFDLAATLTAEEVDGRVIIVPAMNYPAFRAATRTSPLDGANMNRVFPGHPRGSVTEKIAHFFFRVLLPMSDFVLDIHSGGKTLEFAPFAAIHELRDSDQQARCAAAMHAFAAPYSVVLRELESFGLYDTAAEEMGRVFVSTELGGGGTAGHHTTAIARRGVRNFLRHADILDGDPETGPSMKVGMPDEECYLVSESRGLVEYAVALGGRVAKGAVVARVHEMERTGAPPTEYQAGIDGILIGRHFPGLIAMGDVIGVIGVPH